MRVLLVAPSFFPSIHWGGPTTAMHSLCNALAEIPGIELEVLTTDSAGPRLSERVVPQSNPDPFPAGYSVDYCKRNLFSSVSAELLGKLPGKIASADVVHLSAIYSFPTIPTLYLALRAGKPVVWTTHGATLLWTGTRKRGIKSIWNRVCNRLLGKSRSVVIHATSEREAESARGAFPAARSWVLPLGVSSPERCPPIARADDEMLNLIYIGRIDPIKGLKNLIEAMALVPRGCASLAIHGSGTEAYVATLQELVKRLELTEQIEFRGQLEESARDAALDAAHALVLPSYSENFGVVVAEALARGRPVIASTGTPWGVLVREQCGLWVTNDPPTLASAIQQLSTSDLKGMGERAWRLARNQYSWPSVATRLAGIYSELRHS